MNFVIDVEALEAVAKEHSDNKHIVRRDDLKMGLQRQAACALPVHTHAGGPAHYVLTEGTIRMNDQEFELRPGGQTIPKGRPRCRNDGARPCAI
jgi:hypothetical protein